MKKKTEVKKELSVSELIGLLKQKIADRRDEIQCEIDDYEGELDLEGFRNRVSFSRFSITDPNKTNSELTTTGATKMESIKQYIDKHRDIFLTIGIVLLLDHFVFQGAFTDKLKKIVDGFLDKKTKEMK